MEQIAPQIPKKKSRKKLIVAGIIVVVVIIIAAVALSGSGKQTLINGGTVKNLSGSQYYEVEFKVTSSTTLYGSVSATNGIIVYLMTPSEYSSFVSSGSVSSYAYTSGDISSGSFNTNIGSGTYYAVFENPHSVLSTTLTINSLYVQ